MSREELFHARGRTARQVDQSPKTTAARRTLQVQNGLLFEQGRPDLWSERTAAEPGQKRTQMNVSGSGPLTIGPFAEATHQLPSVKPTNSVSGDAKMKITFADPNGSGYLIAQVSPNKTASECIQALVSGGLLGPARYQLAANGKTMWPDQTLEDAGVTEGDTVAIQKMEEGA